MKRSLFSLMCVFSFALAACSSTAPSPTPAPSATPTTLQIALVMKTLTNPFFVEMEKGARQAETEFHIHLIVKTAAQETSIEQQISIIDELVRAKVNAIVIAPGDSKELIPALKKAQDAGIVIVNIDNRLDPEVSKQQGLVNVPYISVDNEQGAYLAAKYMSAKITQPTNIVILEGIQSAKNAQDRQNGALRAFKENSNITVVAQETAEWKIDEAHDVIKSLFGKFSDIKAVYAANDMMALGVVQYLDESGNTGVMVGGFDALQEAKDAISAGKMVVTIDQQAAQQGYLGVKDAVELLHGNKVAPETMVDVLVVGNDTLSTPQK